MDRADQGSPAAATPETPASGHSAPLDPQAETEARKNTITAIVAILAPLLSILALTLSANALLPVHTYAAAGLIIVIAAGALTAPTYALKALRHAKRARDTAKGQVGILVTALIVSISILSIDDLGSAVVLLVAANS